MKMYFKLFVYMSFPDGSAVKNPPAGTGDTGSIPRSERSAGVGNGCYTSILAWQIPWTVACQAIVHGVTQSQA